MISKRILRIGGVSRKNSSPISSASEPDNEGQVQDFLQFMGKNKEEWQIKLKQAREAIRLLLFCTTFQTAERNLLFLRNCRKPVAPR
jgi:hypothetical protein